MKILVLNYEFLPIGGGAAPVSYDICAALAKEGHSVTVVTMGFNGLPKEEIVDGIKILRVPCLRKSASSCSPIEQATYIFSAIFFLHKHLKTNHYDINHTHFIIPTGAVSYWLFKAYKMKYIITVHGSDVKGHNKQNFKLLHSLLSPLVKKIIFTASAVVSPSEHLKGLIQQSYNYDKTIVIPNGIDVSKFIPIEKKNKIISLCRLQQHKGVQHIIRAFAIVKKDDWTLDVVGDGPYRSELETLVAQLNISDCVTFYGHVKNKSELHLKLLGQAKIFVSASDFENFPLAPIEAAASGCNLLLSNIVSHKNYVDNSSLFSPLDENDLSKKMSLIMNETCINKIDGTRFGWEEPIIKYVEVLKGLLPN